MGGPVYLILTRISRHRLFDGGVLLLLLGLSPAHYQLNVQRENQRLLENTTMSTDM